MSWTAFNTSRNFARSTAAKRELLDGIESIANRLDRDERPQQPRPKQPATHGRDRDVELVEQRSCASAFGAFDDGEVLEGDRIHEQRDRSAGEA